VRRSRWIAAALPLALACGADEPQVETLAKPVVVTGVAMVDLEERIGATGELQAKDAATVAAEVPGQVTEIFVDEGQPAAAGQVVLEIDPQRRQLELDSARAELAQAAATLAEAERSYQRWKLLREKDVAAEARMDEIATQRSLAGSRHEAARARVGVAERALRDASVKAPFAGFVAKRKVSRGEYVQVGAPLFELVALDPIEVVFHVAERDSARVALGQTVELGVEPYPGETFRGEVTTISPTIDPVTRTLRVEAHVPNADGRLRPGLFARVDLGVALRKGVLLVPEEAVLQRADGEVVFRAADGGDYVERVLVRTGSHREGMVEITSGLAPGELVVTRGQAGLVDGAAISPRNADGTVATTAVSSAKESAERSAVQ
jgi:membrane fusion protein (multidrug efflux system)